MTNSLLSFRLVSLGLLTNSSCHKGLNSDVILPILGVWCPDLDVLLYCLRYSKLERIADRKKLRGWCLAWYISATLWALAPPCAPRFKYSKLRQSPFSVFNHRTWNTGRIPTCRQNVDVYRFWSLPVRRIELRTPLRLHRTSNPKISWSRVSCRQTIWSNETACSILIW